MSGKTGMNTAIFGFVENHSPSGATIDMCFEMDTLAVLRSCSHPMNPATDYPGASVRYNC